MEVYDNNRNYAKDINLDIINFSKYAISEHYFFIIYLIQKGKYYNIKKDTKFIYYESKKYKIPYAKTGFGESYQTLWIPFISTDFYKIQTNALYVGLLKLSYLCDILFAHPCCWITESEYSNILKEYSYNNPSEFSYYLVNYGLSTHKHTTSYYDIYLYNTLRDQLMDKKPKIELHLKTSQYFYFIDKDDYYTVLVEIKNQKVNCFYKSHINNFYSDRITETFTEMFYEKYELGKNEINANLHSLIQKTSYIKKLILGKDDIIEYETF